MAEDKKISDLSLKTTLDGKERFVVASGGDNYGVETDALKSYAQQGMVAQETGKGLSANDFTDEAKQKLEKLPGNAQFGNVGYYRIGNGVYVEDPVYRTSGLIVLDRNHDLAYKTGVGGYASSVAFFASDGTWISGIQTGGGLSGTVAVADFPAGAVFFAVNTEVAAVASSFYRNGETIESQKNAVATGLVAKLDKEKWDKEHAQFGNVGYFHLPSKTVLKTDTTYSNSGYIPLNHNFPIKAHVQGTSNVGSVAFFDADKNYLSHVVASLAPTVQEIGIAEFPKNAAFFLVSSYNLGGFTPYYNNGETIESREGAVSDAIQASKLALFVDLWTNGYDCQYDATKAEKSFTCNEVELTYEEAIVVYNAPSLTYNTSVAFNALIQRPKTIILSSDYTNGDRIDISNFFRTSSFVKIRVTKSLYAYISSGVNAFYGCVNLTHILGNIGINSDGVNVTDMFKNCTSLQYVNIYGLRQNISFQDSPLLSLESLQYLVANSKNTTEITVTVHPDVYAKLSGETTNAAASALTADELAAWQAVVTAAAAKNIAFATTE